MLNPTPPHLLCDAQGRPYFLWDVDMTLQEFVRLLASPDPEIRAYHMGRLMRQAKPDDVFQLVTVQQVLEAWPRLTRYLGQTRSFWQWLLESWRTLGVVPQ